MYLKRSLLCVALLIMLYGPMAPLRAAEPASNDLEDIPVVLSASRLRQPLLESPSAVTVIDRQMIEASGARHVADLMRYVPGAIVSYQDGNHPVVAMHGMSDGYVRGLQILVDGVSVYSPLWGGLQWEELPLAVADIERVEVIRGPNAAVFGPNSFTGVINIITRNPTADRGWQFSSNAGESGIADISLSHSAGLENGLRYRATFGQRASDGFASRPDAQRLLFANMRSEFQVDAVNSLQCSLRAGDNKKDNGDYLSTGSSMVPHPNQSSQLHFQARWTNAVSVDSEWWVQYYHQQAKTNDLVAVDYRLSRFWPLFSALGPFLPNPLPYTIDSSYETYRDGIELQRTNYWSPTMRAVWGAEIRRDAVVSPLYFNTNAQQSSTLWRGYGNVEWRFADDWMFNAAAMFERNTLARSGWSPKAAVTWQPITGHVFRLGASSAMRTPSLLEGKANYGFSIPSSIQSLFPLFPVLRNALLASGQPDSSRTTLVVSSGRMDSEKMRSEEVGYSFQLRDTDFGGDVRVAREHHTGLMADVPGALVLTPHDFANVDRLDVFINDLTLHWRPWETTFLRLAFNRTDIGSTTNPNTYNHSAPKSTVSLLWDQNLSEGWRFSSNYQRVGEMNWTDIPNVGSGPNKYKPQLPSIDYLTLRLGKQMSMAGLSSSELALVIQNALGRHREYFPKEAVNDGSPETVASRVVFMQFDGRF